MITLILSTSPYLQAEVLTTILQREDPSGFSTTRFPPGTPLNQVLTAAQTANFFQQPRLVVCDQLIGDHVRGQELDQVVLEKLATLPSATHVILLETSLPLSVLQVCRQKFAPHFTVIECEIPQGRALIQWVQRRAQVFGLTMDNEATQALIELLAPTGLQQHRSSQPSDIDFARFDQELAKLAAALYPEVRVRVEDIRSLIIPAEAQPEWGLVNALAHQDATLALREYAKALQSGITPEVLLAQLVSHFEAALASSADPTLAPDIIADETGLSPGRLHYLRRNMRLYSTEKAKRTLATLRSLDAGIKRGTLRDAEAALAAALVDLSSLGQP